jgi:hypothetical protein
MIRQAMRAYPNCDMLLNNKLALIGSYIRLRQYMHFAPTLNPSGPFLTRHVTLVSQAFTAGWQAIEINSVV